MAGSSTEDERPWTPAYLVIREYSRFAAEERRGKQSRRHDSEVEPNEVMAEQALQGRFAAARSRLRDAWPSRVPRVSRPMEPNGS